MCEDLADQYWYPIGATPWSGEFCVIEQCQECFGFRARIIDPDSIPVVKGLPEIETEEFSADDRPTGDETDQSEASESAGDDWLVR